MPSNVYGYLSSDKWSIYGFVDGRPNTFCVCNIVVWFEIGEQYRHMEWVAYIEADTLHASSLPLSDARFFLLCAHTKVKIFLVERALPHWVYSWTGSGELRVCIRNV